MAVNMQMAAFQERLNALEREIAQLSVSDCAPEDYFRKFLEQLVTVLGVGGGIWEIGELGRLKNLCHINLAAAGLEEGGRQIQLLGRVIEKVLKTSDPVVLPEQGRADVFDGGLAEAGTNDSSHTLLFVPIKSVDKVTAVLGLISPPDIDPRAVRGYLGYVQGLCDRTSAFLQRRQIREMERTLTQSDRIREYISALHTGLDPKRACYALANYTQEMLGVYRCMAGSFSHRGKFRVEAVSGVETLAVKSSFIETISAIARQVCLNDKVLLVENPNAALKDQAAETDDLLTAARLYMLQAQSLILGIFPIHWKERVVGALVVEKAAEQEFPPAEIQKIESLLVEAGSALSNSLSYRYLPLSPLTRTLAALRDRIYRLPRVRKIMWTTFLVLLISLPFVIRKQVKVIGTAELIPVDARTAYAEQDGVIESVAVKSGQQVQKGQVLAALDKRIIETEIDRVTHALGEARLDFRKAQDNGLTTLALQSDYRVKTLEAELKKYTLQSKQYEICAPVRGIVISRESRIRQLLSQPVVRGEKVLEIVPDESEWQLLVHIPENEASELLKAYDHLDSEGYLEAKVILNAYPDRTFRTRVLSVARRAHVLSTGEQKYRNVIEVRVAGPEQLQEAIEPRQGMEGKVAIECGKRSLFYVVTYEFADFIRLSLF